MKVSNCFLLNALVYLAVASLALPGKNGNECAASKNNPAPKIVEAKAKLADNQEDLKTDLLLRF